MNRNQVWVLIAVGVAIRAAIALQAEAHPDLILLGHTEATLEHDGLGVYGVNNPDVVDPGGAPLQIYFPYPPLYLAWAVIASGIADVTGLAFHAAARLLPIAADAAIAFVIYAYLGGRGAGERTRLAGAALVMLGPIFIAVSGYQGQFDQTAILPAILGVIAWERRPRRPAATGLLLGVGAAVKTVPGLLALPLAATARSRREAATLVALVVAVPAILVLPFALTHPSETSAIARYAGLPGLGGLSLVADPMHAVDWLRGARAEHEYTVLGQFVLDAGGLIVVVALVALFAFLLRYRPAPVDGAVLLWLTVFAVSPNFFLQYLIWGLPFFIMAGYLREVAALQLALVPAIPIFYLHPFADETPAATVYVPTMLLLWLFWVVALVTVARRMSARPAARAPAVQPHLVEVRAPSAPALPARSDVAGTA